MNYKNYHKVSLLLIALIFSTGFIANSDWVLVKNEAQGYQIEFPKEPKKSVQTVNTEAGPVDMHINMLDLSGKENDSNLIYLSSYAQYPDSLIHSDKREQIKGFLKETVEGLLGSIDGKMMDERDVEIDGFKGKEVKISFQDGMAIIRIRVYLVENQVYMLQVVTKTENDSNESIGKFMKSFDLIN